jgi:hypothetical protein
VINGMRILRIGSFPSNNVFLPPSNSRPSPVDLSGHGLIETYLNEGMSAKVKIVNDAAVALDELSVPVCPQYELVASVEDYLDPSLQTCIQTQYSDVYAKVGEVAKKWDVNVCVQQALFRPRNVATKQFGFDKTNQPTLDPTTTFCKAEHSHFAPSWRPSIDGTSPIVSMNVDYESMVLPFTNQNDFFLFKDLFFSYPSYKDYKARFLPDGWGFRYETIQSGPIPYDQAQVPLNITCQIGFKKTGLPVQTISTSISVPDVYSAGTLKRYFPNGGYNNGEIFIKP